MFLTRRVSGICPGGPSIGEAHSQQKGVVSNMYADSPGFYVTSPCVIEHMQEQDQPAEREV